MIALDNTDANNSPFDLKNVEAYERWRDNKLNKYPENAEDLVIEINDPRQLSAAEREKIVDLYNKTNMAVYTSKEGANPDKRIALFLAQQFGLHKLDKNMGADDDGITSLQVSEADGHERYIPYSNKAIHWHTDGYYNKSDKQIHALNLHCVRPAIHGGENAVMDHEIAYIRLRDENPEYIHALMAEKAMTVPANIDQGKEIRAQRSGPVFSVGSNGTLHMRYTARAHNIVWAEDNQTQAAVKFLDKILKSNDPYIYRLTLQPGWGLISNNVLHDRSGFEDDKKMPRLLYRLRYFDRLSAV